MTSHPCVEKWNAATVNLGQAFLGSISANVRAISLSSEAGEWVIGFVLAQEDSEDVEWLMGALSDFEAMDPSLAGRYIFKFTVGQDAIESLPMPARLIYRRRED